MGDCKHRYRSDRPPCPRVAAADGDLCPWHNPKVDKSAPYVGETLSSVIRDAGPPDLEECHLIGIDWPGAHLAQANLKGADLRDANLRGADLQGADLRGAQLRRADLQGADLTDADLAGADLTDAHFGKATLGRSSLRDTLIEGTVLNSADLRHVDVAGAAIESFYWNRLTRFSGIRGLEPRADAGDATQRYVAPFALGEHDISASRRSSLRESDPDLERTRFYRSSTIQRPPLPSAAESRRGPAVSAAPETATAARDPEASDLRRRVAVFRRHNRQLVVVVFLSVLIAITAVGLALTGQLTRPGDDSDPPDVPPERPVVDPTRTTSSEDDGTGSAEDVAFYRERIAELSAELDRAQRRIGSMSSQAAGHQQRLDEFESTISALQVENARLHAQADEAAQLRRERDRMQQRIDNLLATNSRLERTATILSSGMGEMQGELDRLRRMTRQEQTELALLEDLDKQVTRLQRKLAATEQQLEQSREAKRSLEFDLEQAQQVMDALVRRIQGTPLESMLGEAGDRATEIALQPDVPVVLGGDVLLTFTASPESKGRIRCTLVLQGAPEDRLPEVSVILLDRSGAALHKLGFSFPTNPEQPGFASAVTVIDSPVFPAAARLVATPSLEDVLGR